MNWKGDRLTRPLREEFAREAAIVNDVRPLLDACKSMGDSRSLAVNGKALVWDMDSNKPSLAGRMLPAELHASSPDSPITVFIVMHKERVQVGSYSLSGEPAYRQYLDVAVAY